MSTSNTSSASADATAKEPSSSGAASFFSQSGVVTIFWFLAIYVVVSFVIQSMNGGGNGGTATFTATRLFDFLILAMLFMAISYLYLTQSQANQQGLLKSLTLTLANFLNNDWATLYSIMSLFSVYLLVFIMGIPMDINNKPVTLSLLETCLILVLVFSVIALVSRQLFNWDIVNQILVWFGFAVDPTVTADATAGADISEADTTGTTREEVYNIGSNIFNYKDAKAICKVFGGKLATYSQIEDAYNKGAEWPSMGWSEDQMALFPTQLKTYERMKEEGTPNARGRPGVNGGYMSNTELRFGVNCFGVKPTASTHDRAVMELLKSRPYSPSDLEEAQRVKFWQQNKDKLIAMMPFDADSWSMYST